MTNLEKMKKKRSGYARKIENVEEWTMKLKSLGKTEDDWVVRMNQRWLDKAKKALSELDGKIRVAELYTP